jgi:predicted CXXCH cytochrome family protein
VCAQCHARRAPIVAGYAPGKPFFDYYLPALLAPGVYYVDGQQPAEDYTWGPFLQSRMYAAGVTCSDCHEPHRAKLRMQRNALCTQCHEPARFDATRNFAQGVDELESSIALDPAFAGAYLELADAYRDAGQEARGETTLRQRLQQLPRNGSLHDALGLALVRLKRGRRSVARIGGGREARSCQRPLRLRLRRCPAFVRNERAAPWPRWTRRASPIPPIVTFSKR